MRRPYHLVVLLLVTSLFAFVGCSDEVRQDETRDPGFFAREALDGPFGNAYEYRGRIDGELVFVGELRDYVPGRHMPAHIYSAESGWSQATLPETAWRVHDTTERIVRAGEAHFFLEHIPGEDHTALYRTTDAGQTWEEMEMPADYAFDLRGDGEALYLYEETFESSETGYVRKLWRSVDGAQTWEIAHDALARRGYTVGPGCLVVEVQSEMGRSFEISTDGGASWEAVDENSPLARVTEVSNTWTAHGESLLATNPRSFQPSLWVWHSPEELASYTVTGLDAGLIWVTIAGETVYGSTREGQVGELTGNPADWSTTPPTWQPVTLPDDAALFVASDATEPKRNIFGFGDGSFAVLTESGLLRRIQEEDSWEPVSPAHASADYLVEFGEELFAGRSGEFFRFPADEDEEGDAQWTVDEFLTSSRGTIDDAILTRLGGQLYAIPTTPDLAPSIFKVDLDGQTVELLWKDEAVTESYHGLRREPSARMLEVGDRLVVGSAGSFREVVSASGSTILEHSGGGVFALDGATGQAQPLFDGSEEQPPLSVQSMVEHDGSVWVVSATDGVWNVALDGSGMTRTHDGLPDDPNTDILELVHGLYSTGEALYAYSTTSLWVLEGGQWSEVDISELQETAEITGLDPFGAQANTNAIVDLDEHGDRLVVATLEGIYLLDPSTGEFVDGRTDFEQPIYKLLRTDTGLYVSLWQGGLHRLSERD
ncbi:hypothetical protein FIV42_26195 [Persicimonas caeni]|uniref:Uncharacterized protein n=1 Tax=Persicimonas caeni TaxID=2292766 RepID=A0A4Y6Q291_PERCE|nr:hypothetical protein [Persicimonas caeni]QDG54105.1 hypothetical protein FIV42_26195 [Persicimonas caeni]QED35326.1 hypothetical protein FRD00_26190 [Persicimonas caeni]